MTEDELDYTKQVEKIKQDLIEYIKKYPTERGLKNFVTRRMWVVYMIGWKSGMEVANKNK
jgi:hypothetical protein